MEKIILPYKYIDEKGEHLHTLDGQPLYGTSSVSKVIPPPLAYWAAGLAVGEFGVPDAKVLTKWKNKKATPEELDALMKSCGARHEEIKGMDIDSYLQLMQKAYTAHAGTLKSKAKEGTDLHAELEGYVKNTMLCQASGMKDTTVYEPRIQPFIDWASKNIKRFIWSESYCFSRVYWLGGISDVGAETNDGKYIIIDFKSAKDAYKTSFWQCVGYAIQIEENGWMTKDGEVLGTLDRPIDYVCVVPFGAEKVEPKFYYNMEVGKQMFLHMFELYKDLNV